MKLDELKVWLIENGWGSSEDPGFVRTGIEATPAWMVNAVILAAFCFLVGAAFAPRRNGVPWFRKPKNQPAVYVMVCRNDPRVVKLGYTSRRVEVRAQEISRAGRGPVRIVAAIRMPHAYAAEMNAHKRLSSTRGVRPLGGEWYRCSDVSVIVRQMRASASSVKASAIRKRSWPRNGKILEIKGGWK